MSYRTQRDFIGDRKWNKNLSSLLNFFEWQETALFVYVVWPYIIPKRIKIDLRNVEKLFQWYILSWSNHTNIYRVVNKIDAFEENVMSWTLFFINDIQKLKMNDMIIWHSSREKGESCMDFSRCYSLIVFSGYFDSWWH